MAPKVSILAAALAALVSAQYATAELYISPVLRAAVQPTTPAPAVRPYVAPLAVTPAGARPVSAVSTVSTSPAPLVVPTPAPVVATTAPVTPARDTSLYGKSVPLGVAMQNLIPDRASWSVVFEPGTEDRQVSWKGARDWREALNQISRNHGMTIGINEPGKRIAVTYSPGMNAKLAQPGTNVWQLKAGNSLRENLIAWGEKAGWQVDWSRTQVDYPIDHAATLVGQFSGEGGVVDRVLSATQSRETPLVGRFYTGNHVVVIEESGYKAQDAKRPSVDDSL